jgi:hypothetical protein
MDLIDIYKVFHSIQTDCSFLSNYEPCFKIDYILVHKVNLNKYKIIEIIPQILQVNNGITLNKW